ncbi:MAG: hypothetical protein NVSMB22_14280 [Chloroflexota bacterium]
MPTIVLHGDNAVEIDEAAHALRQPFDPADTIILDGADMPLSVFAEACLTAGLFAPERLVIVNALHERFKTGRKESPEAGEVRDIIASLVPSTTLLLVCKGMANDHALVSDVRKAGGQIRSFSTPRRADLGKWSIARAKHHEATIQRQAADLLAEVVGPNLLMLDTELEKLATYAGLKRDITPAMIETLVGSVAQESIFALVDAVAAGDRAKALQLMHAQMEAASASPMDFPLYLIRMLARQLRILLRLKLALETGRSIDQITSDLKIPRYYSDRYIRQAKRISKDRLKASFEQLASLEHSLKSGRAEPASGLDLLVSNLCA